jgi:hypothetical protein
VNKLCAEFGVVQHSQPVGFTMLKAFGPFSLAVVVFKAKELNKVLADNGGEGISSDSAGHYWGFLGLK